MKTEALVYPGKYSNRYSLSCFYFNLENHYASAYHNLKLMMYYCTQKYNTL